MRGNVIYPVFVSDRDRVREALQSAGIGTNVHYPVPCHLQKGYSHLGYAAGSFPHAEYLAGHELSLPIYAEMSDAQVETVAQALRQTTRVGV